MSFGSSGSMVKAMVSRTEENHTGSLRLAANIRHLGSGMFEQIHAAVVSDGVGGHLLRQGKLGSLFLARQQQHLNVLTLANPLRLNSRYTSVGLNRSIASSAVAEMLPPWSSASRPSSPSRKRAREAATARSRCRRGR